MKDEELIARLAEGLRPVRRLPRPPVLLALWTLGACALIGLAVLVLGLRGGAEGRPLDLFETVHLVAAALTALLAGLAAIELALPDRDDRWAWLPLPAVGLWLGTMGLGCVGQILSAGPEGIAFWISWSCLGFITGMGVPLALGMLWLTRHGALIRPGPVATFGALSAAAFASLGLTLVHPTYGPLMVLAWHGLAVGAVTAGCARLGPRLFPPAA
jgi:hypothetical protein